MLKNVKKWPHVQSSFIAMAMTHAVRVIISLGAKTRSFPNSCLFCHNYLNMRWCFFSAVVSKGGMRNAPAGTDKKHLVLMENKNKDKQWDGESMGDENHFSKVPEDPIWVSKMFWSANLGVKYVFLVFISWKLGRNGHLVAGDEGALGLGAQDSLVL